MMNELLEKITALSAEVTALESEAKRTVVNVDAEISESRAEKEVEIVEFLHSLEEAFKVGGFPHLKDYSEVCCGTHWEGTPNTQGSHGRLICVTFMMRGNNVRISFGRWFDGCQCSDRLLEVGAKKFIYADCLTSHGTKLAGTLRENIIDRWTVETERMLSDWMVNIVTENLKKRLGTATQTIKTANDKREEYFGKEGC